MDYSSVEVSSRVRCGAVVQSLTPPGVPPCPHGWEERVALRVIRSAPRPRIRMAEGLRGIRFFPMLAALTAPGRGRSIFLSFCLVIVALHCGEELVVKHPSFAQ